MTTTLAAPQPTTSSGRTSSHSTGRTARPVSSTSDTAVNLKGDTDPEIQTVDLGHSTMRVPTRAEKAAAEKKHRQDELLKLFSPEEQQIFRGLVSQYRREERRLVELERQQESLKPQSLWAGVTSAWTRVSNFFEIRSLRSSLESIRAEEQEMIAAVRQNAREHSLGKFVTTSDTPALLRRASVPQEKQGRLPRAQTVISDLLEQVEQRAENRIQPRATVIENGLVLSRLRNDGTTEAIMLRYREDGKFTMYHSAPGKNKWERAGTIWNDDALNIGLKFLDNKRVPKIKAPIPGTTRVIEPVRFQK